MPLKEVNTKRPFIFLLRHLAPSSSKTWNKNRTVTKARNTEGKKKRKSDTKNRKSFQATYIGIHSFSAIMPLPFNVL